jgi:hypothetical protein
MVRRTKRHEIGRVQVRTTARSSNDVIDMRCRRTASCDLTPWIAAQDIGAATAPSGGKIERIGARQGQ